MDLPPEVCVWAPLSLWLETDDMTERLALGLTLYGEARGEPLDGQLAVASVIANRVRDGRWGHTFAAVVSARLQFSCWNTDDANRALLARLLEQLATPVGAAALQSDTALQRCLWIADGVLAGVLPSTVKAATHYYAVSIRDTPRWARSGQLVGRVGHHLFFERVP